MHNIITYTLSLTEMKYCHSTETLIQRHQLLRFKLHFFDMKHVTFSVTPQIRQRRMLSFLLAVGLLPQYISLLKLCVLMR